MICYYCYGLVKFDEGVAKCEFCNRENSQIIEEESVISLELLPAAYTTTDMELE